MGEGVHRSLFYATTNFKAGDSLSFIFSELYIFAHSILFIM